MIFTDENISVLKQKKGGKEAAPFPPFCLTEKMLSANFQFPALTIFTPFGASIVDFIFPSANLS